MEHTTHHTHTASNRIFAHSDRSAGSGDSVLFRTFLACITTSMGNRRHPI